MLLGLGIGVDIFAGPCVRSPCCGRRPGAVSPGGLLPNIGFSPGGVPIFTTHFGDVELLVVAAAVR